MDKEIWKDIEGYEGIYQVSNLGNVRSLDKYVNSGLKNNDKVLKKGKKIKLVNVKGYLQVGLCNHGKQKSKLVHRLVANAFIDNPKKLKCINHKDEDKHNNKVENLEWCDNLYNNIYGTRLERISNSLINNSKISKKVKQYDKYGNFIKEWESTMEIERKLGICNTNISSCCLKKGKYKTAGGYKWEYVEVQNVK